MNRFYAMRDIPVTCSQAEFAKFPPASGQTCGEYLAPFLSMLGQGYVEDPSATNECSFCTYSNGNQVSQLSSSLVGATKSLVLTLPALPLPSLSTSTWSTSPTAPTEAGTSVSLLCTRSLA